MKQLLLTALGLMATVSIYAQGSVLFNNSSTTLVKLEDFVTKVLTSAPVGSTYTVGLWWATAGTTDDSLFTFSGQTTTISPVPGRFTGLAKTIPGITPAGSVVAIQVRGWETAAGSYDAAFNSAMYAGKSGIFTVDTGDPTSVPPGTAGPIVQAVGGFTGLTLQVPEPSTIALGLLGLAGLFVLRRRS